MTAKDRSDYFELSDYVGVLRRRWLMITVLTLIGLVLAGGYYVLAPKTYTATAAVQVNALPTDVNALGGRTSGPVNMDNEAQIVQSASVATIVKSQIHSPLSVADLIKDIHVAVPPNTTFLQISCAAATAYGAQQCANSAAQAYLFNRRNSALALVASATNAMNAQANSLQTSVQQLEARLAKPGPTSSPSRIIEQLQLKAKLSRLATIQAHVNALTPVQDSLATTSSGVAGKIVTPAIRPVRATSPRALLTLPSGLAAGLVIGLVGAFFWDRRRPRIHSGLDVERLVDLPVLVSVDHVKQIPITLIAAPRSRPGQALAELAQYAAAALGDGNHVLVVAATAPGSSGSVVAANLACSLARARGETVLVFPQRRGSSRSRLLGEIDGQGFADLLAGKATVKDVAHRFTNWPRLRVIGSGTYAGDASDDMQFDKVRELISDLRMDARYVVIDVPSTDQDSIALSIAEIADAAIVVVQTGVSRPADVVHSVQRLHAWRTTIIGAALVPAGLRPRGGKRTNRLGAFAGAARGEGRPGAPQSAPTARAGAGSDRPTTAVAAQAWQAPTVQPAKQGDQTSLTDPVTGS